MKKLLTLSLILVLAISANAKIKPGTMKVHRNMPAISQTLKAVNKAKPVLKEAVNVTPKRASETGLRKASLKEDTVPASSPFYEKPLGTLYNTSSVEGIGFQGGSFFVFAPAYTNLAFNANAPAGFKWYYVDPANPDDGTQELFIESTDVTLNLDYGNGWYSLPELIYGETSFKAAEYYLTQGGPAYYEAEYEGDEYKLLASNNNDGWDGFYTTGNGLNSPGSNSMYTQGLGVDTAYTKGVAEYMPYAGTPYLLHAIHAQIYCTTTGEATLTIFKAEANEDGTFKDVTDEIIYTGTTEFDGVTAQKWPMLSFEDLYMVDDEGYEDLLTIDCPIVACITFDGDYLVGLTSAAHVDEFQLDNHALQYVEFEYNGDTYGEFFDTNFQWGSGGYSSSWAFMYDIDFNYLHNQDSSDYFYVPAEGGEKTFTFDSYYASQAWDITDLEWDALPEWITVEPNDSIYLGSDGETWYYSGITDLKITVDALPEGVESRTQDIMITYDGVKYILHVVQPGEEPVVYNEFYMFGDFNGWVGGNNPLAMTATENEGIYEATAVIGENGEFKFATPWDEAPEANNGYRWFGGVDEVPNGYFLVDAEQLNKPLTLLDNAGSNFRMEKPGKYIFRLNANNLTVEIIPVEVPGDVNGDGVCNGADVSALYNYILNNDDSALVNGDQNNDNEINGADVTAVYNIILGF